MTKLALNSREEMFARAFALRGEISPAYQEAFPEEKVTDAVAYGRGWKLLQRQGVKARARELRSEAALDILDATRTLAAHYIDVLTAPRDIVQHRRGACRYCHGAEGRYQWKLAEYLERLDEVEAQNAAHPGANLPLPAPHGGFGYDEAAPPAALCSNCNGRGVGYTYVKDTSGLTPEEEAAYEGVKITNTGIEAKYVGKDAAAAGLMKLYGLGAENVRLLTKDLTGDAIPDISPNPMKAADQYREFMLNGKVLTPSS